MRDEKEKIIDIRGLNFSYGNTRVLEDIDLSIYSRDFLGVMGPNGGGKTTLLKIMLGLLSPSSGEILYRGKRLERRSTRKIGYVPQILSFMHDFPITVLDVILTGRLGWKGVWPGYCKDDLASASEALRKVDLLSLKDKRLSELSGGQVQRVMIARALVTEPELLLLDEPTSNIDSAIEKILYELLAELNREMPIVIVSHDIGVVASHVNKIACLNRKLYYHDSNKLTQEMLEKIYHCPIDLVAHGVAHRVFPEHGHKE